MSRIFVNLPVQDLERSKDFYDRIGFTNEPRFTDNTGACMVLTDEINVMLLTRDKFSEFTPKPVADANQETEVLNAVSRESREDVDRVLAKAIDAGASEARKAQDLGFMYVRAFNDPDGHIWEVFWMDESGPPPEAA